MLVPYGAYQPDRPEVDAVQVADNVIPTKDGYKPHPSLYVPATAVALPGPPRGMFSVVKNDGTWVVYGFTADAVYQLDNAFTWTLIDNGYALPSGYDWSVLHFGTKLLFTNTVDGLLAYDVEAGGAVVAIPAANDPAFIFQCGNQIIGLNCLDYLGARNNRLIRTSGFNDHTNWADNGSDYQELPTGEELVAGFDVGDNTSLLLQNRALTLMQFGDVGGGATFALRPISEGEGATHANSCVGFNRHVFFRDTNGFHMYSPATGVVFISGDAVTDTFLADLDQTRPDLVQGAVDPLNDVVRWRYKDGGGIDTYATGGIGFEWRVGKWFTWTENVSYLARLATSGITIDSITDTIDSYVVPFDARIHFGGEPVAAGLDENYKAGTFSGANLAGTITSQVINNPVTGLVGWATPIDDCATSTLELGVKDQLSGGITWKTAASKVSTGRVPLRGRGMNIQFRQTFPAEALWSHAKGIAHIQASSGGPK